MDSKKLISVILLLLAVLCPFGATAEENGRIPSRFHFEPGLSMATPCHKLIPVEAKLDFNYNIHRMSIHAIASGDYFIPKEGLTEKYNGTFNLGGGLGYELFRRKINDPNIFEARAWITTSVGSREFSHLSYNIGLEWHTNPQNGGIAPTVGFGYSLKDFSKSHLASYNGLYVSFGMRF